MQLPDRAHSRQPALREQVTTLAPPVIPAPEQREDFFEILRKLWRRRYIVLTCAAVIGGLGALVVLRMPSYYVAEARVLVGVPQTRIYNIEPFQTADNVGLDSDRVQNEEFIIQSRGLAQKVIDQLNLRNDPEFNTALPRPHTWKNYLYVENYLNPLNYVPASWTSWMHPPGLTPEDAAKLQAQRDADRMVDVFLNHVDVSTLGRSHVLSIQVDSESPYKAANIANALAAAYLQQQREQKVATTNRVESYLTDRIKELREQVEKSEQAVAAYRKENGLYNTGKDTGLTSQQLGELNTQLVMVQTAKAEADARLHEAMAMRNQGLEGSGPDSVPDVLKNPLIQNLKQQQANAEAKLADLSAQYGPRHPLIMNARAEVSDIRNKIAREMNHVIDSIRQEARTADARYGAMQGNLQRLQQTMGGVNEKTIHLEALERDATVNRNLLEAMLSRLKEAYGRQELEQADARLVSEAAAPEVPSYPPKGLILALTGFAGLLAGALIALTRENVDRTFRVSDQVEAATGLPVISMVPSVDGATPPTVHVLRHPVSAYSEALRRVHIGLELADPDHSPKTVLFTSAAPAEGKSVMVASLGRLLASNGKRVLLIDCDWRCPNLHRLFRCPNKGGLAALLNEEETNLHEIIYNDSLSGLDLIVAGVWNPQSIHKLTAERMRLILQTFAKNYDIVILDSAPILVGAEVLTLSRMVDKVSFVLRWGHTRREVALEAIKQLVEAQGDVAGVVMARVDPKRYREYAYGSNMNYEYVRPALISVG